MGPIHQTGDIIWLKSCGSTNRELRERMDTLPNLSVIAATEQTAGRGQGSHTWHASPGCNLTFSCLYRPALPADALLLLTCVTTLALRDYLGSRGIEARIKWPNDIWVGDKKICGILIENVIEAGIITKSIVGIGLNVNEENWPEDIPNPVSMKELTGVTYRLDEELQALQKAICRRFQALSETDGRRRLQEEFEKYMFKLPEARQ
ncbi:MAG: biotin--[acetyl-CoA-carboxylase] ligase [Bacteroidales bacterium]|nr:biotin--[acetyl-CoA-carboxylase] ligase [Bacteroidales bacterium]